MNNNFPTVKKYIFYLFLIINYQFYMIKNFFLIINKGG